MPEGVEVKLSCDLIKPLVIGKQVTKCLVGYKGRYAKYPPEGLNDFNDSYRTLIDTINIAEPLSVIDIRTKGKFMYWKFSNGWYMFSTFGMTGQWSPVEGKHLCLKFRLIDPVTSEVTNIHFNDPRHFGTIKFTNKKSDLTTKLNELGWDPLNAPFDSTRQNYMVNQILVKKKCIGEVLMDQTVFAGVGNYIRAEALYLSSISPWRDCNKLSKDEVLLLCNSFIHVMNESYSYQGATILTYKDAYGAEGRYSSCFKVYGQATDPHGDEIIKEITPEGRTIHWCPNIQK